MARLFDSWTFCFGESFASFVPKVSVSDQAKAVLSCS